MAASSDPQRDQRVGLRQIPCFKGGKAVAEAEQPDFAAKCRLQVALEVALADGGKRAEADDTVIDDRRQGDRDFHGRSDVFKSIHGFTRCQKPAAIVTLRSGNGAGVNEIAAIRNGGGDNMVVMEGQADHMPFCLPEAFRRWTASYLILASRNRTCLRAFGSYLRTSSFSGLVRGFFFVT